MRRLLPASNDEISVEDAYRAPLGHRSDRPWVSLCMVASIDGSTVMDGASAGLSSSNDIAVLSRLRSIADVIIVGAGTARGEGYGPPKKPGQRIGVITRSGNVDTSTELFASGAGFIITSETARVDDASIDTIRAGRTDVDLVDAVRAISGVCPEAETVQAEGGPSLNGALGDVDLIDEINMTMSPATVSGGGPRLLRGGEDHAHRFELAQLAVDDDSFLFTRWLRRR